MQRLRCSLSWKLTHDTHELVFLTSVSCCCVDGEGKKAKKKPEILSNVRSLGAWVGSDIVSAYCSTVRTRNVSKLSLNNANDNNNNNENKTWATKEKKTESHLFEQGVHFAQFSNQCLFVYVVWCFECLGRVLTYPHIFCPR